MTPRTFRLEVKLDAVMRMEAGCNVSALAEEIGVFRAQLYRWYRAWKTDGVRGLCPRGQRGRALALQAGLATSADPATQNAALVAALRERIMLLEGKVGQQQLDLDFFRLALRHIEVSSPPKDGAGATASTPASGQ